jgi:chaperone modulatory protein CbpM
VTGDNPLLRLRAEVVEEVVEFTLVELSQACNATPAQVAALVAEGVLAPAGQTGDEWRFAGTSLRRARLALRLARDLELNPPALALVLDMLDEITSLRARLARQHRP